MSRAATLIISIIALGGDLWAEEPAAAAPAATAADLDWNESWPRFRPVEYGTTLATGLLFLATTTVLSQRRFSVSLGSENGLDTPVSDALILSRRGRARAGLGSDILQIAAQIQPLVVDAVLVAGLGHENWDVSWQMTMMNLQAVWTTGLLIKLTHIFIERSRPYVERCASHRAFAGRCDERTASFPSGHTIVAATGAGLACAHHRYLPLYGGGLADRLTCYGMIALASTVALQRVMAAQHYATDVLAGLALGFAGGYGLPVLLHYGAGSPRPPATSAGFTVVPEARAGGAGVALLAWF